MIDASPDVELVARYTELKLAEEAASKEGKTARRAIVAELRSRHTVHEVAHLLGISETRVGQIMRGGR